MFSKEKIIIDDEHLTPKFYKLNYIVEKKNISLITKN